jgi:hypothetical protein
MARVFLPGIGFREPGLRLSRPVTQRSANGRAVTITELVSTPDGTDLVYEVEWHGEQDVHSERDRVVMRGASTDPACRPGGMAVAVRQDKLICTRSLPPVETGIRHVEIEITGDAGEWRVPLELEPFGSDEEQRRREVGISDTRHDVTITVDSITFLSDSTAVELRAHTDDPRRRIHIGGLHGLRDETTAMRLHDSQSRTYVERTRNDARDQFPDRFNNADVAVFDPLSDEVGPLVLEVPYACGEDRATSVDVALPVREPITVELAGAQMCILATREAELPGSRGPAIAVDLDVSTWHEDRRVIAPLGASVDGRECGISWGNGLYAPAPIPAPYISLAIAHVTQASARAQRASQFPSRCTLGSHFPLGQPGRTPFSNSLGNSFCAQAQGMGAAHRA